MQHKHFSFNLLLCWVYYSAFNVNYLTKIRAKQNACYCLFQCFSTLVQGAPEHCTFCVSPYSNTPDSTRFKSLHHLIYDVERRRMGEEQVWQKMVSNSGWLHQKLLSQVLFPKQLSVNTPSIHRHGLGGPITRIQHDNLRVKRDKKSFPWHGNSSELLFTAILCSSLHLWSREHTLNMRNLGIVGFSSCWFILMWIIFSEL